MKTYWQLNNSTGILITWDNTALVRLEQDSDQQVVRNLIRRGNRVREAARHQIRFGHVGVGGQAAKGGRLNLRDTVHTRLVRGGVYKGLTGENRMGLPIVLVGSEDQIALLHHEGSRPHIIVPRRAKYLVFFSPKAGRVIYSKKVNHPGTKPNRYLTDNLHLAAE